MSRYITLIFLVFAFTVHAGEKVDKTLEFENNGYIDISNINGEITVASWNKPQVKVVGELSDTNDEFVFEREGNRISIEMREKSGSGRKGDNLLITVPRHSNIKFESPNATFAVSDIVGAIKVESVNGPVRLEKIEGPIRIESINGKIESKEINGDAALESVNGAITLEDIVADSVKISAVNGSTRVQGTVHNLKIDSVSAHNELAIKELKNYQMHSVSANSDLQLQLQKDADVRIDSVAGNTKIEFLEKPSARFDIQFQVGGTVINKLTDDRPSEGKFGMGKNLSFTTGSGDGQISISTVQGRVELRQK